MTQCKAPTIPGHLNAKQKRFCKEYLIDLNGTAAAKRAGYSAHTAKVQASRLLSNDAIRDYINSAAAAALERVDVSVGWVLNGIKNVVERCSQAVKPVLDSRGEQVMIEDQDASYAQLIPSMLLTRCAAWNYWVGTTRCSART